MVETNCVKAIKQSCRARNDNFQNIIIFPLRTWKIHQLTDGQNKGNGKY